MLFGRITCVASLLLITSVAFADVSTSALGRSSWFVTDSDGEETTQSDDVEIRSVDGVKTLDLTWVGSGTWAVSCDTLVNGRYESGRNHLWAIFVNGTKTKSDSMQICTPKNSVNKAALQDDAVDGDKLDDADQYYFNPPTVAAPLGVYLDDANLPNATAVGIQFGTASSQKGVWCLGQSGSNSTAFQTAFGGSNNGKVGFKGIDTGTGTSSYPLSVLSTNPNSSTIYNSQSGAGGKAQETVFSGNGTIGHRLTTGSGDHNSRGIYVDCNDDVHGIEVDTGSGGVGLKLTAAAESDTLLYAMTGTSYFEQSARLSLTTEIDDGQALYIHQVNDNGYQNINDAAMVIEQDANAWGLMLYQDNCDALGKPVLLVIGTDSDPEVLAQIDRMDGTVGLLIGSGGYAGPSNDQGLFVSMDEEDNLSTEAVRVEFDTDDGAHGVVIYDNSSGPVGAQQSHLYCLSENQVNQNVSLMRGAVSEENSSVDGLRIETAAQYNGSAITLYHNSGTTDGMDGIGIQIDLNEEYDGPGYIYCSETGGAEENGGPMIYLETKQTQTVPQVELRPYEGPGLKIVSEDATNDGLEVLAGGVDFVNAGYLKIPANGISENRSFYYSAILNALEVYDPDDGWMYEVMTQFLGKVPKGAANADTLIIALNLGNVTGTGASWTSYQAGARPYVRIAKADGNFACWTVPVIPQFDAKDSLIVHMTVFTSATGGGANVQCLSIGAEVLGELDVFNAAGFTDTTSTPVTFDASTADKLTEVTIGMDLTAATEDNLLLFNVRREDDRGDDTNAGDTGIVQAYLEVY